MFPSYLGMDAVTVLKACENVYNIWWLNSGPIVVSVNVMPGYPGTEPHHPDNSCSPFPETQRMFDYFHRNFDVIHFTNP